MGLLYKQLTKQIGRNRIFVFLLFSLTFLTALSFFFVKFSIDGNKAVLDLLPSLNPQQIQYRNALASNTSLAYIFFISMTGLTSFVFVMFFYRFFRSNKKQIGCLKSLGFKDRSLCFYFVVFVAFLSLLGSLVGLLGGYFLSSVLIDANVKTYSVTGLIKDINPFSLIVGFVFSTAVFCFIAFLCYSFVRGKEPGLLISGEKNRQTVKGVLLIANKIVKIIPIENKFPLRIALRKPLAVLLIFVAVMSFNICVILGQSLNISSQKIYQAQTEGHNYEFDTQYSGWVTESPTRNELPYLYSTVGFTVSNYKLEQTIIGLYQLNELYELQSTDGTLLPVPDVGSVYINPGLANTYGVRIGDILTLTIDNTNYDFTVAGIVSNVKSTTIYVNAAQLSEIIKAPDGSYNGIWSMDKMSNGGIVTDKAHRIDNLEKNAVSNNTSAVINQVIGGVVGCILIFLALLVNFQDNLRDMLVLNLIGYRAESIRKMLIDIYKPIVWTAFLLTILPSIFTAKSIQKSLSIATNDYMPFGTNIFVVLMIFVLLNIIYWVVQKIFLIGIKIIIKSGAVTEVSALG